MKIRKKISVLLMSALIISFILSISIGFGSGDFDPLVTLSYVEKRVKELREYIDDNMEGTSVSSPVYEVVKVNAGKKIIFKQASLEFILRSGEATAIASGQDGLSDLTSGLDVGTGESIQKNHLILVPRNDSRGIMIAQDNTYVMIKGKYEIRDGE